MEKSPEAQADQPVKDDHFLRFRVSTDEVSQNEQKCARPIEEMMDSHLSFRFLNFLSSHQTTPANQRRIQKGMRQIMMKNIGAFTPLPSCKD